MLVKAMTTFGLILAVVSLSERATADGARVISSEVTSRYVDLGLGKVVAIELPRDAKDVVVGDPKKVTVVMRSTRRAYIVGSARGHTSVYFFDGAEQQIAALDIDVSALSRPVPPSLEASALPLGNQVLVYRGTEPTYYICNNGCYVPFETEKEKEDKNKANEIILKIEK
jgi:hypothetical protein